tara:strand:+ start:89 stop:514 length:426 start_codon:yes stop_codon:yes gene_type:complete
MSDITMILGRIGATLGRDVAPHLEGHYAAGHARMSGLLAVMAGELLEKEADLLVTEITRIRSLLEAGGRDSDVPEAPSLRLSDLRKTRNALAEKLITLQTQLEARDDEGATALNTQIWGHLLSTSVARMPSPPVFHGAEEA